MPRTSLVLAAAVLSAVAACGGKPAKPDTAAPSTTSAPAVTKEQFVAQANAICKRVTTETDKIGDKEPTDAKGYETALETVYRAIQQGQTELRALPLPEADRAEIEQHFLEPNDRQVDVLKAALPKVQAAGSAGDKKSAEKVFNDAAEAFGKISDEQADWGKQYGLTDCFED